MKRDRDLIRKILLTVEAEVGAQPKTYQFEYSNGKTPGKTT
jgi:hypothetical protein